MREIKFQAWDSHQKKMLSWEQLGEADENNWLSLWNVLIGAVEHIKPRQCTGLKDKNGVEIYEGDVLKWENDTSVFVVIYENGAFRKRYAKWDELVRKPYLFMDSMDRQLIYVIGNIHQHPHLLEKSK